LNIAIIAVTFPSTSETFILSKVLNLAKRGHNIAVFCDNINIALLHKNVGGVKNVQVVALNKKKLSVYAATHPFIFIKAGLNTTALKKLINFRAALHYINLFKPDIIHAEFSGLGVKYLHVIEHLSAKKVVSCRGSAEKVKLLASDERKEQIKQLFSIVDAIHCVSDDMKQTILPYCLHPYKIFINYPSIDETVFKRAVPYISNPFLQILSIGRFTFQKGYLTGLLSIKKLKESYNNFKWIIVGDGVQKEEIIFHINQMQLGGHVVLAGSKNRDEILQLYNSVDIFFLPSVYEGIANVALEAMSMELPVVATRSGGIAEVITHNTNGMLADVYDSNALADHLLGLTADYEKRKALGVNARQRILNQFTINRQTDVFETAYNKLINN
jgi:colanic acid/amylovoran biosynthesis glycosyltransferase